MLHGHYQDPMQFEHLTSGGGIIPAGGIPVSQDV
jgi:hypothetical protein